MTPVVWKVRKVLSELIFDELHESTNTLMIVIDRCISEEGNFIEISELAQDISADTLGRDSLLVLSPLILERVVRSYGSFSPDDLVTMNEMNSSRSKVVNRAPHFSHSRRRRIALPSSVARESITFVSRFLHFGHFIIQVKWEDKIYFICEWNAELRGNASWRINGVRG